MSRAILLAGVLVALAGPASAQAQNPEVIPFPGTPDASPTTQIIFSSVRPAQVRWVQAVGTRSGAHPGRLSQLPDHAGTAFVPDRPFLAGEHVSVSALVGPGSAATRDTFTVGGSAAAPATAVKLHGPRASRTSSAGPGLSFRSAPGLHPPAFTVTRDPDRRSGDVFLTPTDGPQSGPMILNARGQLVWFYPLRRANVQALNLEAQRYHGHPVLTWFKGTILGGEDVIMNSSYRRVATVRAGDGYTADLHEFTIAGGTAWLDAYVATQADERSVGGPAQGPVFDCVIQQIDIRTGRVLWEWHSLGHVPLTASYAGADTNPFDILDYFHLNSIQVLPDGNLLISARNTWAVYEISRRTGKVIWTLGGKRSSFTMRPGTNFEWQHDAQLHPGGVLTLFDDAAYPPRERQSSAKVLQIDTGTRRVTLIHRYTHAPRLLAGLAGSVQILPNHDLFVGWGGARHFSEYTPRGRQIFDGFFSPGVASYRAFRLPWQGRPQTRPQLATAIGPGGAVTLYASWNGATQVGAWRVLAGTTPDALKPLHTSARTGFETAINLRSSHPYLKVQGLNSQGHVLGSSRAEPGPGR